MKLTVTGINHKTAPVEVRERVAFDAQALVPALATLHSWPGVFEALILSTCNRVEIALVSDEAADARSIVLGFLERTRAVAAGSMEPHVYHHEETEAIQHIFRVASSLDSMVVGEPQILGQIKSAYAVAREQGALGAYLDAVFTRAFGVAKRVRSETEIGRSAVSISYVAVELAREIFGSLAGKNVLLVGAGKMSELAARYLHRAGANNIFVTNRTHERAVEMAHLFEGVTVEYDHFLAKLPEMDIVITSSGAPHYVLRKDDMRRVIEARRNKPMFVIDIAVPRNVEPSVNDIDHVFLYDIDDIQKVVDSNRVERLKQAEGAEAIISEEVQRMVTRLRAREVAPVIVSLQEHLEQLRLAEIERVRGKLGVLTPQQEEALESMSRGIIHKIAHPPIAELRRHAVMPDGLQVVDLIRRLFRLDD